VISGRPADLPSLRREAGVRETDLTTEKWYTLLGLEVSVGT